MAKFPTSPQQVCLPARVYFWISFIGIAMIALQNLGLGASASQYHVGHFSCKVPHTGLILLIQSIYVLFWTYVLHLICKDGHVQLSWLLVLLPWILSFVMIGMLMINA